MVVKDNSTAESFLLLCIFAIRKSISLTINTAAHIDAEDGISAVGGILNTAEAVRMTYGTAHTLGECYVSKPLIYSYKCAIILNRNQFPYPTHRRTI